MFTLRLVLRSLIIAAAALSWWMIPLRGGDLVTFHGQYWLGLGGDAVSETASDGEYTVEFVFVCQGECVHAYLCLYASFTIDNGLIHKWQDAAQPKWNQWSLRWWLSDAKFKTQCNVNRWFVCTLWYCHPEGRNTLAQTLDVWSVWRDSDEVGNKYVWCVQLRRKNSEPRGHCRIQLSMQSLRRRAVGRLSHWILWLGVCQLNGRSDWQCASESAQCVGGAEYCVHKPLVYNSQHKRHTLIVSCASAERTHYCGVGSTSKRCVQCNFSAERVRQEAMEWSESGRIRQLDVWAVCGGLQAYPAKSISL